MMNKQSTVSMPGPAGHYCVMSDPMDITRIPVWGESQPKQLQIFVSMEIPVLGAQRCLIMKQK